MLLSDFFHRDFKVENCIEWNEGGFVLNIAMRGHYNNVDSSFDLDLYQLQEKVCSQNPVIAIWSMDAIWRVSTRRSSAANTAHLNIGSSSNRSFDFLPYLSPRGWNPELGIDTPTEKSVWGAAREATGRQSTLEGRL
jgi:hypothetical protein